MPSFHFIIHFSTSNSFSLFPFGDTRNGDDEGQYILWWPATIQLLNGFSWWSQLTSAHPKTLKQCTSLMAVFVLLSHQITCTNTHKLKDYYIITTVTIQTIDTVTGSLYRNGSSSRLLRLFFIYFDNPLYAALSNFFFLHKRQDVSKPKSNKVKVIEAVSQESVKLQANSLSSYAGHWSKCGQFTTCKKVHSKANHIQAHTLLVCALLTKCHSMNTRSRSRSTSSPFQHWACSISAV